MSPGQRAALYAYRATAVVARSLPESAALRVGSAFGIGLLPLLGSRRRTVERNLRRIHGQRFDSRQLAAQVRSAFASYGRYWWGSFRLTEQSVAEIDDQLSYEGVEHLEAAMAAGRGAVMALPHIGSWDFGGMWLATHGYPTTVVVEPLEPPELFDWFADFRRRLGVSVVPLGPGSGTVLLRALGRNEVVGLVCDRDIVGDGVEVELFGERTTLPGGPATLALRTGAPILPTAVYFEDGGRHRGVIRPAVSLERTGRLRQDVTLLTQALARELEVLIRRAPEQWHVFQPNWPSDRS